jgi:uncharacterized protein
MPTALRQRDPLRHRTASRCVQCGGPRPRPVYRVLAAELVSFSRPLAGVTEICHLLADPQRRGRPELASEFCAAVAADELRVIEATPHDYRRMAELLTTYASLRLQVVDACIVAVAERLDVREIAALDRRDFLVVAPRHLPRGERLTLLPAE